MLSWCKQDDQVHEGQTDHDSFLGGMADDFNVPREQGMEKLKGIFDRVDTDNDGQISEEELVSWLKSVLNQYILNDVEKQWANMELSSSDGSLSWDKYLESTYHLDKGDKDIEEDQDMRSLIQRDERRWNAADVNNDKLLSLEEFGHFLHPEEVPHLVSVVVDETIDDMDTDKDGRISEEEYVKGTDDGTEDGDDSALIESEREQFRMYRDTDKDGYLNHEEVKEWIAPSDYDSALSEAQHLIGQADSNKNGMIDKSEMLDHYDMFVGSQFTDFGEYVREHDEL